MSEDVRPEEDKVGAQMDECHTARVKSGRKAWRWVLAGVVVALVVGWLAVPKIHDSSMRMTSTSYMKQIGFAVHNYAANNSDRLPADICDPDSKPLLSWRVAILPYIDQDDLYKQFHLDEPWDSPNNKPLLAKIPKIYTLPPGLWGDASQGLTYYQGYAGPGTIFDPTLRGKLHLGAITNGVSNTVLAVEAADPVPWTKPADLPFDPEGPLPPLRPHFGRTVSVLFCDGVVQQLSPEQPDFDAKLRAMIHDNRGQKLRPE